MELLEKLTKTVVERLGVSESEVTLEASFTEDLGADSLDVVELIMEIEDAFDVEIPDEVAEKLTTVRDVIAYLEHIVG